MNLYTISREEFIKKYLELEKELEKVQKEKEALEKELRKYKNSNTPSSANKHLKMNTQNLKVKLGAKRGAPFGHKGRTNAPLEANETIQVFANNCPTCNGQNIRPTGYIRKRKVICYQKAKVIIKEYQQTEYICLDDKIIFLARHNGIPEKGIYDKTILSLVNYYKFKARMPHKIIADVMNNIHDVPMTAPTSLEITRRASDRLEPLYKKLEEEVKKSDVINGDETSISVNGSNHWIWVFCNKVMSLFKIKKERGGKIVEEVLGKDFKGKLVSDGWATYSVYTNKNEIKHQRCFDHLRREMKYECKKTHPDLYNWCCDIYSMTKSSKEYVEKEKREEMYEKCKLQLSMLVKHMEAHKNLRKLATKIKNGEDKWFTCILYPELPIDNNEAERSLRPFVVMRKIMGCLRSEIGKNNYEIMMSLISTWDKQDKNVFYTLQNTL